MKQLAWKQCYISGNPGMATHCPLGFVDLERKDLKGIYGVFIVWLYEQDKESKQSKPKTVDIDFGKLDEKIKEARGKYTWLGHYPELYVTWAAIEENEALGIVRHLYNQFLIPGENRAFSLADRPLVLHESLESAMPIPVTLPKLDKVSSPAS